MGRNEIDVRDRLKLKIRPNSAHLASKFPFFLLKDLFIHLFRQLRSGIPFLVEKEVRVIDRNGIVKKIKIADDRYEALRNGSLLR